jgi:hypothetical protein
MGKLLLAQIIAHIIADFYAQPECLVDGKRKHGCRSRHIYIHTAIVFVLSFLVAFSWDFILCSILIATAHFVIDLIKTVIERKQGDKSADFQATPTMFFADQILHILTIWLVVHLYWEIDNTVPAYYNLLSIRGLLIIMGLLLCIRPANIMIKACLSSLKLNIKERGDSGDAARAGRWIGSIERVLAFVLILLQQYTAIGFIIAAKSILRYSDRETYKAEYVLVGTLLSFLIAFLLGVVINERLFGF